MRPPSSCIFSSPGKQMELILQFVSIDEIILLQYDVVVHLAGIGLY